MIDADEFKKSIAGIAIINDYPPTKANALCELIDTQPTVYNIDGKVALIKDLISEYKYNYCKNISDEQCSHFEDCGECLLSKVIKIVKEV